MKIVFCVSSMHAGGAERVAATLSSAWAQQGHEVTLLATYSGRGSCFYALHPDVRMVWLADSLPSGSLERRWRKPWELRRMLRERSPDVIVSFLTNVNVTVLAASRGLGIPVVVSERTNPAVSNSAGRLLRLARRLTYRWADSVVVQTEEAQSALRRLVPAMRASAIIPNPLPDSLPDAARQAPVSPRRCVVAMGRLSAVKRFDWLIAAFAALAHRHPGWDLRIWGEGPMREELERRARDAGLAGRVQLPGRTDTPWDALRQGDVFALTSRAEGFPNAMLEAMALGLPCVAVSCPSGPAELSMDGRHALLSDVDDQEAFISHMDSLMRDAQLRQSLGVEAAQSVRRRYSLPAVMAQWDALFASLGQTRGEQT